MEEQHHQNYEYNENFGFNLNAFPESDNFTEDDHMNEKSLNESMPTLIPLSQFESTNISSSDFNEAPTLYELPPTTSDFSEDQQFQELATASSNPSHLKTLNDTPNEVSFNIQSDPIIETEINQSPSINDVISETNIKTDEIIAESISEFQNQNASNEKVISDNENQELEKPVEENNLNQSQIQSETNQNNNDIIKTKEIIKNTNVRKRRRIVLLNEDDSDDENEMKKEMLEKSSDIDQENTNERENSASNEADVESEEDDTANITNPDVLKARVLLKSAVMIQGPDKKKKKHRILESDDEEDNQIVTSVDDIGLLNENDHEMEEEAYMDDILIINETPFTSIENEITEKKEIVLNSAIKVEVTEKDSIEATTNSSVAQDNESEEKSKDEKKIKLKVELENVINPEDGEIEPSLSVEAVLDHIKPIPEDDEFFKFEKSSDEKDDSLPNEEYFGSPDKFGVKAPRGRKRGPKPGSRRKPNRERERESPKMRRKRGDRYEKDFVADSESGSDSDSDYSESSSSSSSSGGVVKKAQPRGRPPVKKPPPVIVQTKSFTVTKVPIRKKIIKRDRFYDRSRNIPNDVYFGDVKVPLHVLHSRWNNDESSGEDKKNRPERFTFTKNVQRVISIPSKSKVIERLPPAFVEQQHPHEDPKLSTLKEFVRISGLKLNYGKLFDGIRSTDQKCMLIRRIFAQKGMQGEPTITKCKKLKRDLQAKRESAELDKSVILNTEGRTRRSKRNSSVSSPIENSSHASSEAIVQPEILQTLSKIKSVIDSESE